MRTEWQQLTTVQSHPRRWPMPVAAALSTGLPLLCGAYFGDMRAGLIGSLGGIAFLHLPETPFHHRMVRLMACAFALAACYSMGLAIGQVSGLWLKIPLVTVLALMITLSVRYYRLPPPGPIFFITAAPIGAYARVPLAQVSSSVGLLFMGALGAVLTGFVYSVLTLAKWPPTP